jgi:FtsP/CotA-like multicopper oxidase with cupredoxin domain
MERRAFPKGGLGLGAWMLAGGGLALPALQGCRPVSANGSRRRKLPIPTLLEFQHDLPVELTMQAGRWEMLRGIESETWGFNGPYLGPTVRLRTGQDVPFVYRNNLSESIAVHGHGLHVPGDVDGGPQREIAPGDTWSPVLPIRQQACTSWYHPHTHGRTGQQVCNGLAGFLIIDDENSEALPLPSTYGVDDIPIVVQDRTLDRRGRLLYSLEDVDEEDGFMGEMITANGISDPLLQVPAGLVRLRLLNGSNARFYRFRFADDRTFHKIATDGGFLEAPVPLTELIMLPGERNEIVVDFSDGRTAMLVSGPKEPSNERREGDEGRDRDGRRERDERQDRERDGRRDRDERRDPDGRRAGRAERGGWAGGMNESFQILELRVDARLPAFRGELPSAMNRIERPPQHTDRPVRRFELNMGAKGDDRRGRERSRERTSGTHDAMNMFMGINGQAMDMSVINERVRRGEWERWRVQNDDGHHPFHVHGCSFLVLSQDGRPVAEQDAGWKDTVWVADSAELMVRFDYEATDRYPYMYHCHILEHEDMGMMGQFTVT